MAKDSNAEEEFDARLRSTANVARSDPQSNDGRGLGAERRPSPAQLATIGAALLAPVLGLVAARGVTLQVLHALGFTLFAASTLWRAALLAISRASPPAAPALPDDALPSYTVIAPLYREAAMVRRLAEALCALDYPPGKLQVILALEADDPDTRAQADALPALFEVVIAPPGAPRTKPRACNLALARAHGACVVIYDAEDRPDPGQLRAAAARFAVEGDDLACLQAPLRVPLRGRFLPRQFALEYAALFEVMLPGLARLGAPFPLGGTSNHFRAAALRQVGGWDPWNVTEDADVGFRLAAAGFRLGVIAPPTWELPPDTLDAWTPQRARWLKGYWQTLGVQLRRPLAGGAGHLASLSATIGLGLGSALLHGPIMLLFTSEALLAMCARRPPHFAPEDLGLLLVAWGVAAAAVAQGARRAGGRMRAADTLLLPAGWLLQSVAMAHALVQLIRRPHHWDKTPHAVPADEAAATPCLDELAGERVSRAA